MKELKNVIGQVDIDQLKISVEALPVDQYTKLTNTEISKGMKEKYLFISHVRIKQQATDNYCESKILELGEQ